MRCADDGNEEHERQGLTVTGQVNIQTARQADASLHPPVSLWLCFKGISGEIHKKHTGYCIIACVPMWRRVRDSTSAAAEATSGCNMPPACCQVPSGSNPRGSSSKCKHPPPDGEGCLHLEKVLRFDRKTLRGVHCLFRGVQMPNGVQFER